MSVNPPGIEFTTFSEAEPEKCLICLDDTTSGLAHKTDEVFHRFHTNCLQPWVEQNRSCPTCRKPVTSVNGAPLENLPVLQDHPLLTTAARNGDVNAVLLLLNNGDTITDAVRGQAIITAARNGHIDTVRLLLTDHTLSEEHRGEAMGNAAQRGHIDIIRLLLTDHTISEESRGYVVVWAALYGHIEIVHLLLTDHTISEEFRGYAVLAASQHDHIDIVRLLLTGQPILLSARIIASAYALTRGNLSLPRELLMPILSPLALPVVMVARSALMSYLYHNLQNLEEQT